MARPNSKALAVRDFALAALVGAAPSNFGQERRETPEADTSADFGVSFGDDDYDPSDIGVDFGADAAPAAGPAPSTAQLHQMWQKMATGQKRAQQRSLLLEPNKDSHVKIERYSFSLNTILTLSTPSAISLSGSPATNIRPQRVSMNAPAPAFATIDDIKVANVSVLVGGLEDAFGFNANGVGQHLDMPTLTPANKLTVSGNYSGLLPSGGFVTATPFIFVASFRGPASIVA